MNHLFQFLLFQDCVCFDTMILIPTFGAGMYTFSIHIIFVLFLACHSAILLVYFTFFAGYRKAKCFM